MFENVFQAQKQPRDRDQVGVQSRRPAGDFVENGSRQNSESRKRQRRRRVEPRADDFQVAAAADVASVGVRNSAASASTRTHQV